MWLEAGAGAVVLGLRVVAGVGRGQPELEASTAEPSGACGGEWWVRFCESALGLPANSLVLLLGPACVREASCTLSGAQFKSLYIWSVAVSAIVPRSPGKAANVSLACILSLMHLRLSWAVLTQHFSCEH